MGKRTRVGMLAVVSLCFLILTTQASGHPAQAADDGLQQPPAEGKGKPIPTVQLIQPSVRNIVRVIGRPSFVESYERTPIQSKVAAYVETWYVDIGDRVKKGEVLARLFAPELAEDLRTKKASVKLDQARLNLALGLAKVAEADQRAAEAHLKESRLIQDRYQAEVDRWDSEVNRLKREVERKVVDARVLVESTSQLKSSAIARDAARAAIEKTEAELLSKQAALARAKLDITVAKAALAVTQGEEKRLEVWNGYLTLTAPFDGVVVARNANTFDLVQPAVGATPLYVIDRNDIVRIFADIPERDASYVHVGSKASVQIPAYREQPIPATIVRTSWALNVKSRTLRAEIDLPNQGSQLLPGMYAYVKVVIERPAARALPLGAIIYRGEKTFCWTYADGHAVATEIETGTSDGEWIEVKNRRVLSRRAGAPDGAPWTPINGSEQVILGNLAMITDGAAVQVAPAASRPGGTLAGPAHRAASPASAPAEGRAAHQGAATSSEPYHDDISGTEEATLALEELRVELALEIVKVAEADVMAAKGHLGEAQSILAKCEAEVERWDMEVNRLKRGVDKGVVDPNVLSESTNRLKSAIAARDAAKAAIRTGEAELNLKKATLSKAKVDVKIARAELAVARSKKHREAHPGVHHEEGQEPRSE